MARRPIVHIQVWPNARERRVVERLVKQTRISGGTFSGCGARFSVPPQASACGEPARRAEARRSTLKRAPRGTSRPFTYTQMYIHLVLQHTQRANHPRAGFVRLDHIVHGAARTATNGLAKRARNSFPFRRPRARPPAAH